MVDVYLKDRPELAKKQSSVEIAVLLVFLVLPQSIHIVQARPAHAICKCFPESWNRLEAWRVQSPGYWAKIFDLKMRWATNYHLLSPIHSLCTRKQWFLGTRSWQFNLQIWWCVLAQVRTQPPFKKMFFLCNRKHKNELTRFPFLSLFFLSFYVFPNLWDNLYYQGGCFLFMKYDTYGEGFLVCMDDKAIHWQTERWLELACREPFDSIPVCLC